MGYEAHFEDLGGRENVESSQGIYRMGFFNLGNIHFFLPPVILRVSVAALHHLPHQRAYHALAFALFLDSGNVGED